MAKKRLNIKDKTGQPVDYDISAENVTIDGESGKPLTQKLDEIAETEAQAVRSITFNGQSYSRDNGSINIGEQEQPNWNESNPNYRTYIRNKPTLLSQFVNDCGFVTSSQIPEGADLSTVFASVAYDPTTSRINFFGKGSNTVLAYLDAAPFIVDGMVENVTLDSSTNELVITFNTASGKSPIRVQLCSISGQGTVQSVKMNGGTPIQPVNGVIDLGTVVTEHQSLSSYATKNDLLGKQDTIEDLATIRTNAAAGATALQPTEVKTINGQSIVGSGNIPVVGQTGAQGLTGNCNINDANQLVTILVNNFTTGGADNIASAETVKILRQNVDRVQSNLQTVLNAIANIAFTSLPKPTLTALDWNVPRQTVTFNTPTNMVITQNGNEVSGTIQADYGETITLLISPATGYTIASLTADNGTLTQVGDNYTLELTVTTDVTITFTGSAVIDTNFLYNGVRYEPESTGAYLHVGQIETYMVSPLIDLGASRSEAVNLTFATNGSTSANLGLVLFDSSKEYAGFIAQSSAVETESISTAYRYVRVQTDQANLATSYVKQGDDYLWNGSGLTTSDASGYDDFMASEYCPQPNAAGDYDGWIVCAANTDLDLSNETSSNPCWNVTTLKTAMSLVTAVGGMTAIPWVMSPIIALPSDKKITFCSGEKTANGYHLPVLNLLVIADGVISDPSFYTYSGTTTSSGGVRSETVSKWTHCRNVVRKTYYDSASTAVYVTATTSGDLLWGNQYAHDTM